MKQIFLLLSMMVLFISVFAQQNSDTNLHLYDYAGHDHPVTSFENENIIADKIKNYLSALEGVGYYGSVLVELKKEKIISSGYGFQNKEVNIKNSKETVF